MTNQTPKTQKAAVCHGALDLRIVSHHEELADDPGRATRRRPARGLRHDQDGPDGFVWE